MNRITDALAATLTLLPMVALSASITLARTQPPALPPEYADAGIIAVPASLGYPIFVQIDSLLCLSDPDARWFEDGSANCDARS